MVGLSALGLPSAPGLFHGASRSAPRRGEESECLEHAAAHARGKTLRLLVPEGSEANIRPVLREFSDSTGCDVQLESVPVDEVATFILLRSGMSDPGFDLALPPTFSIPDLVEADALLPLDGLAERFEPRGFSDQALYSLGDRYKDKLYGYQADGDAYVMFYRRDFLEDERERERFEGQHGYPLAVPKTWRELDAQIAFFHRPEEGMSGGCLFRNADYLGWEWWIRFHSKGLYPLDEDMNPRVATPAGVEALEELVACTRNLAPSTVGNGLFENWHEFASGNSYANIGWGGTQKFLNRPDSAVRDRLLFGPTPGAEFGGEPTPISYFNWGWNFVTARRTPSPELAYLFSLYASLSGPSTRAVRATDGFFDPHRPEHYDDPQIVDAYSAEFLEQHAQSLSTCIPDLYLQGRSEYVATLNRFLSLADQGTLSPKEALQVVDRSWQDITERIGRESQVQQWRFLKSRYPRAIARHLS